MSEAKKPEIVHRITLKHPVRFGPETLTVLEFIEARGKHVLPIIGAREEGGLAQEIRIAAELARVPYETLQDLSIQDLAGVKRYVEEVIAPLGQTAGAAPATGAGV